MLRVAAEQRLLMQLQQQQRLLSYLKLPQMTAGHADVSLYSNCSFACHVVVVDSDCYCYYARVRPQQRQQQPLVAVAVATVVVDYNLNCCDASCESNYAV